MNGRTVYEFGGVCYTSEWRARRACEDNPGSLIYAFLSTDTLADLNTPAAVERRAENRRNRRPDTA